MAVLGVPGPTQPAAGCDAVGDPLLPPLPEQARTGNNGGTASPLSHALGKVGLSAAGAPRCPWRAHGRLSSAGAPRYKAGERVGGSAMSSAPAPRSRSCPRAEEGLSAPGRPPSGAAPALLCLLLLLAACSPATGSSPGIKGRVTQRALEYGGCLPLPRLGWEGEMGGGLVGHPRDHAQILGMS